MQEARAWVEGQVAKIRELTVTDRYAVWASQKRAELEPELKAVMKRKIKKDWPKVA